MMRDVEPVMAAFVYDEMAEGSLSRLKQFIPRLAPTTRLRLLAFVHLLENPEELAADLTVEASGTLRLTLAAGVGGGTSLAE